MTLVIERSALRYRAATPTGGYAKIPYCFSASDEELLYCPTELKLSEVNHTSVSPKKPTGLPVATEQKVALSRPVCWTPKLHTSVGADFGLFWMDTQEDSAGTDSIGHVQRITHIGFTFSILPNTPEGEKSIKSLLSYFSGCKILHTHTSHYLQSTYIRTRAKPTLQLSPQTCNGCVRASHSSHRSLIASLSCDPALFSLSSHMISGMTVTQCVRKRASPSCGAVGQAWHRRGNGCTVRAL